MQFLSSESVDDRMQIALDFSVISGYVWFYIDILVTATAPSPIKCMANALADLNQKVNRKTNRRADGSKTVSAVRTKVLAGYSYSSGI